MRYTQYKVILHFLVQLQQREIVWTRYIYQFVFSMSSKQMHTHKEHQSKVRGYSPQTGAKYPHKASYISI